MVDAEQALQDVRVVVAFLHVGDGELLLVGEALHGAHHRPQRRLRRQVGPFPDARGGPGEQVDHRLQRLPVGGGLAAEVVQRPGDVQPRVVQGLHELGQPDVRQVPQLLLAQVQAAGQDGVLLAELGRRLPFADEQDGGGDAGARHDDERRSKEEGLHQILVQGSGRGDRPVSRHPVDRLLAGGGFGRRGYAAVSAP
ncbi:hypothetical protein LUX73_10975 [Actinomadura madurae]|nr:hypothetical protein [Actinomadura madurae]MCQ0005153.1 hypothetical protein [Actinomadura madurae]